MLFYITAQLTLFPVFFILWQKAFSFLLLARALLEIILISVWHQSIFLKCVKIYN